MVLTAMIHLCEINMAESGFIMKIIQLLDITLILIYHFYVNLMEKGK